MEVSFDLSFSPVMIANISSLNTSRADTLSLAFTCFLSFFAGPRLFAGPYFLGLLFRRTGTGTVRRNNNPKKQKAILDFRGK